MRGAHVSVLMPTFAQEEFLPRAVASLFDQTLTDWELIVVDDGSPGDVCAALGSYLDDRRVTAYRFRQNRGLGAALNAALERSSAPLVAYLPSDDVLYADHLASLVGALRADANATLAFSGVKHEYRVPGKGVLFDGTAHGQIEATRSSSCKSHTVELEIAGSSAKSSRQTISTGCSGRSSVRGDPSSPRARSRANGWTIRFSGTRSSASR